MVGTCGKNAICFVALIGLVAICGSSGCGGPATGPGTAKDMCLQRPQGPWFFCNSPEIPAGCNGDTNAAGSGNTCQTCQMLAGGACAANQGACYVALFNTPFDSSTQCTSCIDSQTDVESIFANSNSTLLSIVQCSQ